MPNFKKLLQGVRKFEALQTSRKAKDVPAIRKFQLEFESHREFVLRQHLDFEQRSAEARLPPLQTDIEEDQRQRELKTDTLPDMEAFAQESQDFKTIALPDIEAFNQESLQLKMSALPAMAVFDRECLQLKISELPEIETFAQEILTLNMDALADAETFDREAFEAAVQADHFENVVETQETAILPQSEPLKQLPPGPPDPFGDAFSELTETSQQHELESNAAALKQAQAEATKNPQRQTLHVR